MAVATTPTSPSAPSPTRGRCLSPRGHAETRFIEQIASNVEFHELAKAHLGAVQALMEKYGDLPMDLADASLVVAARELGDGRILTTDQRDFNTYRWKNTRPFRNLLEH